MPIKILCKTRLGDDDSPLLRSLFPRLSEGMIVILPFLALIAMEGGSTEVLEEFEPKGDRLHINQPINLRQEWKLSFQVKNPIYKLQDVSNFCPPRPRFCLLSVK